ncbi:hypothetical protein M5G20_22410 [Pseudomonas sp. TNT2022 ID1044]|uniref:hypothetical protein n=1 Tax=Pseudomonas sp. TNT2022 ID1044 TaxID=2942636 RepID=UPI002360EBB6|nr:hypothetical protein [Pseudomonas sp. TNT2022 ID1044]MDD0998597.1 hypothetical protein [Pseudomonas sp. TNT2022 ID1044]
MSKLGNNILNAVHLLPIKSKHPLALILAVWLIYLAMFGLLQILDTRVGFEIWPIGEDRNWIYLLKSGNPVQTFQEFWALDHRNPMAALWWILASPIIKLSDWGLHAIAQIVSPIVACITFVTLDRLGHKKHRLFSLMTGLVVLLWNFPARHDHVDRVMVIALAFTLLSIYFYTKFIDNQRVKRSTLAIAIACYLIALSTYTIQSGAIIAVVFIAFFRTPGPIKNRLKYTTLDSALFFSAFAIYTAIWIYFAGSNSGFKIGLAELMSNAIISIKAFIYPPSVGQFLGLANAEFPSGQRAYWYTVAGIFSAITVYGSTLASRQQALFPPIGWVLVLLISIGTPTIFVEAGNPTWGPGSRSIMVQQVWQPLFLVCLIFIVATIIRPQTVRTAVVTTVLWALCTKIIFVAFAFNHSQTIITLYQRNLGVALRTLDEGQTKQVNYIIKVVNPVSPKVGSEPTLPSYAATVIGREKTFLRVLMKSPSPLPSYDSVWRVGFGKDGVTNGAAFFDRTVTPYENVKVVEFNGVNLVVPPELDKDDFEGFQVDWWLDGKINQQ